MRGKNRFGLLTGIAVLMLLAFASAALAKPDWVSIKYTGCRLLTVKNTEVTDGNHRKLVLYFDVINNSKEGDIITAIRDHHRKPIDFFSIKLKEADQEARKKELARNFSLGDTRTGRESTSREEEPPKRAASAGRETIFWDD